MGKKIGIGWDSEPLGEVLDVTLAAKLGCTRGNVAIIRNTRGIPRFTKGKGRPNSIFARLTRIEKRLDRLEVRNSTKEK